MPRKRKSFAQTWWGEKWLEVLDELGSYWPNRLPRGRRYARSGAVVSLDLFPAQIAAKVKGTRATPYRVSIRVRPFSPEEKERFLDVLKRRPLLAASLLQLKVPAEILETLEEEGLELLPTRPEEFEAKCSCPDWANPCKHIAAVFYVITEAIDRDPFNLFLLRGITKKEILASLELKKEKRRAVRHFTPKEEDFTRFHSLRGKESFPPIRLPDGARELIFSLLQERPVFYPEGDLKKELCDFYEFLSAQKVEDFCTPFERPWGKEAEAVFLPAKKRLFLSHPEPTGHRLILPRPKGNALRRRRLSGYLLKTEEALGFLLGLSLEEELSPAFKTYVYLAHLLWGLIIKGHFIPQVKRENGAYSLVFRPYLAFREVKKLFRELAETAPLSSFLQWEDEFFLPPEDVFFAFLSEGLTCLLRHLASHFGQLSLLRAEKIKPRDPVERAFWEAISAWLAPLEAPERENRLELSLLLSQARKYWYLSFLVKNRPFKGLDLLSPEERKEFLDTFGLLSRAFPALGGLEGRDGLKEKVRLSPEDLIGILGSGRKMLEALDIPVAVKGKLRLLERIKLKGKTRSSTPAEKEFLTLNDLLNFDLRVVLGEKELTLTELKDLLKEETPLLRLRDEFVLLSPEELSRLKKLLSEESLSGSRALLAALTEEVEVSGESFPFEPPPEIKHFFDRIRSEVSRLLPPRKVKARLRPYQLTGFRWLVSTLRAGFGACLADDMGLGKTLQTICLIVHLLETEKIKRALIVAPTTLLGNWQQEFVRFAPEVETAIYHGPNRTLTPHPVLITSYGTLRSDQEVLSEAGFDLVVLDEAQNIKNPEAAQTRAVYRLAEAPFRVALSGTPVENRLLELWSIFRFLNPGLLGSRKRFLEEFARPIEFWGDEKARERLRRAVAPFILRREKTDPQVIRDLPEKIEKDEWCLLSPRQAVLYQQVVKESLRLIEETEGIKRKGLVLKLLLFLKQICAHPALYTKHRTGRIEDSGKLLRLMELLEEIRAGKEKVLIFSQFKGMGEILKGVIAERFGETPFFIHGGVPRKKREELVQKFETETAPFVFILSLKAGGTGLNLVSATHVVHYDLWWNPAVEAQATDRAYRIGQRHRVLVHRLLTRGTLEEKINELLEKKKSLAAGIISSGEKWITELSNEELRELVAL